MEENEPTTKRRLETIFSKGKLFELVHIEQDDGRIFEVARRAPGVRLIICNEVERSILLNKEYRRELNDWDYRLPGGKVFDSLDDFNSFLDSGNNINEVAVRKAKAESFEEAGIEIIDLEEYKKSVLGATIEWDLFVFVSKKWKLSHIGQQLEDGEQIETGNWFSYEDVAKMIMDGKMNEERIALILLQWLEKQKEDIKNG